MPCSFFVELLHFSSVGVGLKHSFSSLVRLDCAFSCK